MKKSTSLAMAMGWVFSISVAGSAYAQTVEIGTWAGFHKAAVSFTFDDGAPSHVTDVGPLFDNYGFKATFNLVTTWKPDWSGFQEMANNGHEIASHSDNHGNPMPDNEIASSKSTISKNIKNNECITLAYPNCTAPNKTTVLQNYIAGRICGNGSEVMGKNGPSNWAEVPAIMTGVEQQYSINFNSVNQFTSKMQEASQKDGWVMFLTHGLAGKNNNGNATFSPTDLSVLDGALSWASTNDIWVGTFRSVTMYIKERNASKITASTSGNSITIKLTHSIADNISKYDYPLSLRVKNTGNWTSVSGTQDRKAITTTIKDGYIYFDAVPNAGDIVISSGGSSTPTSSSATQPTSSSAVQPQPTSSASTITSTASITIEMEDYMEGGQGVSYNDLNYEEMEEHVNYRSDDAGLVKAGDGYAIGYTKAGEWFNYSVEAACEGQYSVVARAATGNSSITRFSLSVDNVAGSVAVDVPSTGDWDTYTDVEGSGTLKLSRGKNVVKVNIDESYVNVDWIKLTSDNAQCPVETKPAPAATSAITRFSLPNAPSKCEIFDIKGQHLKAKSFSAASPKQMWQDMSAGLKPGVYLMRYSTGNGSRLMKFRK